MKKNKGVELPAPPTFQANPNVNPNIDFGTGIAKQLLNSDYTGRLSGLADLVSYNPLSTQLALSSAKGFLTPQYNDLRNQAVQDATNANALNSSTFTDALAKNQFNLESQYQGIAADAALKDKYAADANRMNLFQYGGNLLNAETGLGLQSQGQENDFNLRNYENQVAATLAGKSQPGSIGGLTTALGMGLGALFAAPTGGMSMLMGAGLGGAIGGGLGATVDSYRGANTASGIAGLGGSMGLMGGSYGVPNIAQATGQSYLPSIFAQTPAATNPYGLIGSLGHQGNYFGGLH